MEGGCRRACCASVGGDEFGWIMGAQVVTTDVSGLRTVRESIASIPEGNPIRSILGNVVDSLERMEVTAIHAIAPVLLAYGQALSYDGQFALAQDVFSTIHTRAEAVDHQETALGGRSCN